MHAEMHNGEGEREGESRKSRTMNVLITQLKLQCVLVGEGEERLIITAAIVIMYHRRKKEKKKKNKVYSKMEDPDVKYQVLSASLNIMFGFKPCAVCCRVVASILFPCAFRMKDMHCICKSTLGI